MLSPLQFITSLLAPLDELNIPLEFDIIHTLDGVSIGIGDRIAVQTLCYGVQIVEVKAFVPSPYYGQDNICAYVEADNPNVCFTDYISVEIEVAL